MKRCEYCYTDNPIDEINCNFCKAPLEIERKKFQYNNTYDEMDFFYFDYDQLKDFTHIELLQLAIYAKQTFDLLVPTSEDPEEIIESKNKHRYVCQKKIYLIENLLFDQLGRVPKKNEAQLNTLRNSQMRHRSVHKKRMNFQEKTISKMPHHDFLYRRFFERKW